MILLSQLAGILNVLGARLFVLGTEVLHGIAAEPGGEFAEFGLEACHGFRVHVGLGDHFREVDDHAGEVFGPVAVPWSSAFPLLVFARLPELADLQ